MNETSFIDANGKALREGFYVRNSDNKIYYLGNIEEERFSAFSEGFPDTRIVPTYNNSNKYGDGDYAYFAKEFSRIDEKSDPRMRRKGVREIRRTLKEMLIAA